MADLLDAEQVGKRLGLTERTVRNLANRGEITGVIIANTWRFEESDVEAYIAKRRAATEEKVRQAKQKAS